MKADERIGKAQVTNENYAGKQFLGSFVFNDRSELDEFIGQLLKEYQESIIKAFPSHEYPEIVEAIRNAPNP